MPRRSSSMLNHFELRAALARQGWPYYRLASRLGISPSALSAYLHGKRPAPADLQFRVERALKLAPGSLTATAGVE